MIRWNGQPARNVWRNHAGTWRAYQDPAKGVFANVAGTWRKAWPQVAPTPPVGTPVVRPGQQPWGGGPSVFTSSFSVEIVGGTGPFRILWSVVLGTATIVGRNDLSNVSLTSTVNGLVEVQVEVFDEGSNTSARISSAILPQAITQPLAVSINPASRAWSGTPGAYTASFNAVPSGGSTNYGYTWSATGGAVISAGQGTPNVSLTSVNGAATVVSLVLADLTLGGSVGASSQITAATFPPLVVTASPGAVSGTGPDTPVYTADTATATVTGGSGQGSGFWEWNRGTSTGSIVPSTGGARTSGFMSGDVQAPGSTRSAGFQYTYTDSVTNQTVSSNSVIATLTRTAPTSPLSAAVIPETQPWPQTGPYRVSTMAVATGGREPYTYEWNDTGPAPYPPSAGYFGEFKEWESTSGRQDAFVSVNIRDADGQVASASGNITELG